MVAANRLIKQMLFRYKGYGLPDLGELTEQDPYTKHVLMAQQSCRFAAMDPNSSSRPSLEGWKKDMAEEDAKQLVRNAKSRYLIRYGPGSNVDLPSSRPTIVQYLRGFDEANVKGPGGRSTSMPRNTEVLTESERRLHLETNPRLPLLRRRKWDMLKPWTLL